VIFCSKKNTVNTGAMAHPASSDGCQGFPQT